MKSRDSALFLGGTWKSDNLPGIRYGNKHSELPIYDASMYISGNMRVGCLNRVCRFNAHLASKHPSKMPLLQNDLHKFEHHSCLRFHKQTYN